LADIVRTPLYGVAMTIVNLTALIFGLLAPETLYDFREVTGKLVQSLYRKKDFVDDLFACFQPLTNLKDIGKEWGEEGKKDTKYPHKVSKELKGMINFSRSQIKYRRENYSPFNGPCGNLDPKDQFISPSYENKQQAKV
jgi:hypothetical protein